MKDSTSAASAGAELVLRRFPGAVLVRWPVPPPPETLSDRWLQAAEEEEEPLPFRSPPREENGTEPGLARAGGPRGSLRGAPGSSAGLRGAVASGGAAGLTRKRREGWRGNGKGKGAGSELGLVGCAANALQVHFSIFVFWFFFFFFRSRTGEILMV